MIFTKFSINRIIKNWEKAIAEKRITHVKMMPDQSIVVHKVAEAKVGSKTIVNGLHDQYEPNSNAAKAMLSITGPLQPGEIFFFENDLLDGRTWEEVFSPSVLRDKFQSNYFHSADINGDGSINLYIVDSLTKQPGKLTFSSKDHIEAILEATGTLTPGQVFCFDQNADEQ